MPRLAPKTSVSFDWVSSMCLDVLRCAQTSDDTAKLWDAETGRVLFMLRGHSAWVQDVCSSSDGHQVATASWDNTPKIWNAETGQEIHTLKGHTRWVLSVCYSPDGERLATGSQDSTVKLWYARNRQDAVLFRHQNAGVSGVCFSPDSKFLAAGGGGPLFLPGKPSEVAVWDVSTGRQKPYGAHPSTTEIK